MAIICECTNASTNVVMHGLITCATDRVWKHHSLLASLTFLN